jgi:hypothetical protein
MTGNWLIGGNMKVNRVLPDEEVKAINDAAGTADLPRLPRGAFAAGGAAMFEGIHEDLQDEQGNPLELWHGTSGEGFSEFKNEKIGERDSGFYGRGHYLTPHYDTAEEYASDDQGEPGTVMGPLHAALKNPYVWDMSNETKAYSTLKDLHSMGIMRDKTTNMNPWDNLRSHEIDTFMKHMNQRGHDGVIVKQPNWQDGEGSSITEVVAFNPSAIKHKDAAVFDPKDPNIYRANGGEVNNDNDPISLASARAARNQPPAPAPEPTPELVPTSARPPTEVEGMFNRLADKRQKSQMAYDAAKADGIFEKFPFGDVYKYKHSPNPSPMTVIGHRMLPVEAWGGLKPPKYVYHNHYPVLDMDAGHGEINPYPVELMEDKSRYDWIKGKPRAVKKRGGALDAALALTRRFTKR